MFMNLKALISAALISFLLVALIACEALDELDPRIPGPDPIPWRVISKDSITSGTFMGMAIGDSADDVYKAIRRLPSNMRVDHLQLVNNQSSDLYALEDRIPLYSYLVLDEHRGSDKGVQISLENGRVSAIFLNSGKSLARWPQGESKKSSVILGDKAESLYDKLVNIRRNSRYRSSFERISLMTKDLDSSFDPAMAQLPQWYFSNLENGGEMRQVQMFLTEGRLAYVLHSRMAR